MTPAILAHCWLNMTIGKMPEPGEDAYRLFMNLYRRVVSAPDFNNLPNPENWKKEKKRKTFTGPKKPSIADFSLNQAEWGTFYEECDKEGQRKRQLGRVCKLQLLVPLYVPAS